MYTQGTLKRKSMLLQSQNLTNNIRFNMQQQKKQNISNAIYKILIFLNFISVS